MHIIAGLYKNKTITAPKGLLTRPTSGKLRESLFNICQNYIDGARFLDLFAGSGAVGIEALSRGAKAATFIDNSRECIRCIQQNFRHLHIEASANILFGDVFQTMGKLNKQNEQYEIIYADPPYDAFSKGKEGVLAHSERVLKIIDDGGLLVPSGMLFIEDSTGFEPDPSHLSNLIFKSSRRMGRSVLHQFEKKGEKG